MPYVRFLVPVYFYPSQLGRISISPSEHFTLGFTLLVLGVAAIIGVVITSPIVPVDKQVDYAALGTWTFFAMNAVIAVERYNKIRQHLDGLIYRTNGGMCAVSVRIPQGCGLFRAEP